MSEPESSPSPPAAVPDAATTPTTTAKRVYLIRHAESLENQRISSMLSCFGDLGRFSLPKKEDVGASFGLLNIHANADAPVSPLGLQQCEVMKDKLAQADFLRTERIQLVAHSPLERARQTCQELFGCSKASDSVANAVNAANTANSTPAPKKEEHDDDEIATETITFTSDKEDEKADADTKADAAVPVEAADIKSDTLNTPPSSAPKPLPEPVERVVNLDLLSEKTHKEWLPGQKGSFEKRVADFQMWLAEQPESIVCVVGHSQFFKQLLGLPFKFDNVDVYQVTFDAQKTKPNEAVIMEHDGTADEVTLTPQWFDLKLRFSCKQNDGQPQQPQLPQKTQPQETASTLEDDDEDI